MDVIKIAVLIAKMKIQVVIFGVRNGLLVYYRCQVLCAFKSSTFFPLNYDIRKKAATNLISW